MSYFKYLPTIQYYEIGTLSSGDLSSAVGSSKQVSYGLNMRDIFVRYKIRSAVLSQVTSFYPYLWKEEDRPDTVAKKYYGSEDYWWLVYYSNGAFDYHFDFAMPYSDLLEYMVRKYYHLYYPTRTITFDQYSGSGDYSVGETVTDGNDYFATVTDWNSGTRTLTVKNEIGAFPTSGSIEGITSGTNRSLDDSTQAAVGPEVLTTAEKQDVLQNLQTEIDHYVYTDLTTGDEYVMDSATPVVLDAVTTMDSATPVYIFDQELANNEAKRRIKLLDKQYLSQITNEFQNETKVRRIRGR